MIDQPEMRIGPYKLLKQIGEGAAASIYAAEQTEPVQRIVALKVIKPGMNSKEVIARFGAERQALGMMGHPNIVGLIDAGTTESGLPFLVMELVRGVPITDYCDQNGLELDARLALFADVCRAFHHVHQKGIVHRDIEPSNVLVYYCDGRTIPKVIDFGIVKAAPSRLTDPSIFKGVAPRMIGKPCYMSPEQAESGGFDVDARSDVYSLGVLLYELLTGTTPLEKDRLAAKVDDEVCRLIREEDPPKPSERMNARETTKRAAADRKSTPAKLSRMMTGELDCIAMKAIAKERTVRYQSADALALVVGCYLKGKPIVACPRSYIARIRQSVRRNKAAAAILCSFGIAAAIGLIVAALGFGRW